MGRLFGAVLWTCVYDSSRQQSVMTETGGSQQRTVTRPSWGSWKIHAVLLVTTFGMGNVAYGVYRRYLNPKTHTVTDSDAGGRMDADVPYRTLGDLESGFRENVEDRLVEGEEFILGIRAADSLRGSRKTRWILTNRRVVSVQKGLLSEENSDIPLSSISTVEYDQGMTTEVTISGSGVDEEFYTAPGPGKAFVNALRGELVKR